ncbi:MAG: DUF6285 domain-containing protein [Myxococcota bacterium]|jgi:hypothetical protein|nr:DUF6285 domain-containing protein [Myxococcota bacterium]
MNDRPTTTELLAAVERFLEESAVPALDGPAKYHARVAANVVRIVARELACEDEHVAHEWDGLATLLGDAPKPAARDALHAAIRARNEALVRRIRAGEADAGAFREALLAHLSRVVADKLDVAQPPRPSPRTKP